MAKKITGEPEDPPANKHPDVHRGCVAHEESKKIIKIVKY